MAHKLLYSVRLETFAAAHAFQLQCAVTIYVQAVAIFILFAVSSIMVLFVVYVARLISVALSLVMLWVQEFTTIQ